MQNHRFILDAQTARAKTDCLNSLAERWGTEEKHPQRALVVTAMKNLLDDVYASCGGEPDNIELVFSKTPHNSAHPETMHIIVRQPAIPDAGASSRANLELIKTEHAKMQKFERLMKRGYAVSLGPHPCGALRAMGMMPDDHGYFFELIHSDMPQIFNVLNCVAGQVTRPSGDQIPTLGARLGIAPMSNTRFPC